MTDLSRPASAFHLTEEERHCFADGSLVADRLAAIESHLSECAGCSADVARLRTLMTRVRDAAPATATDDDAWPGIRARIEQGKIIPLDAQRVGAGGAPHGHRLRWAVAGLVAAALLVIALPHLRSGATRTAEQDLSPSSASPMVPVSDSVREYEQEVAALLNQLEMQRAMQRPGAASIDRELHTIDQAIAELKEALLHDPNNPALRRLLASSYRQKIDLLKRSSHAG